MSANKNTVMNINRVSMLVSVSALILLTAAGILVGGTGNGVLFNLTFYVDCAVAIILVSPSLRVEIGLLAAALATVLVFPQFQDTLLSVEIMLSLCISLGHSAYLKYSRVRSLFRNDALIPLVELASRMVTALLTGMTAAVACAASSAGVLPVSLCSTLAAVALYVLCAFSLMEDLAVFVPRSKMEDLRAMTCGCLRPHEFSPDAADKKMNSLYRRCVEFMEKDKPYLKESFSLCELSRTMYSNKTYLSKTINVMSGRNFKQFVNYYRVCYSMEVMKENPKMLMDEVASVSGFHTVVSFNMAFKLFTRKTPADWRREITNNY